MPKFYQDGQSQPLFPRAKICKGGVHLFALMVSARGSQSDIVYIGLPIELGLNQWIQLCTWSTNKLWRSNSISPYLTYGFSYTEKTVKSKQWMVFPTNAFSRAVINSLKFKYSKKLDNIKLILTNYHKQSFIGTSIKMLWVFKKFSKLFTSSEFSVILVIIQQRKRKIDWEIIGCRRKGLLIFLFV